MKYYLRIRGKSFGPFDEQQLLDLKEKGKLSQTSELSINKSEWSPAGGFGFLFPPPAAAASASASAPANTHATAGATSSTAAAAPPPPPPSGGPAEWYYSTDGETGYGPITTGELIIQIRAQTLNAESLVWKAGQGAQPVRMIPQFTQEFVYNSAPQSSQPVQQSSGMQQPGAMEAATGSVKERFMWLKRSRLFAVIAGAVLLVLVGGWWTMSSPSPPKNEYATMYATLDESIDALDSLVDETYRCWHGQIYDSKYRTIEAAIAAARQNESSNVSRLERNDKILLDLVKKVQSTNSKNRDKELYDSMLGAYDSYKEYYEFGYNVSGSFSSFGDKIESQKKETKSYLNKFKRNL